MSGHHKHIPQRTCISCRKTTARQNLVRLVLTPEGLVQVDKTGKKAGRGAYLCPEKSCLKEGVNSKRLERAFRTKLPLDSLKILVHYIEIINDGNMKREEV